MNTLKQAIQKLSDHRNKNLPEGTTMKYDFEKEIISAIGKRNFLHLCNSIERTIDEERRKLHLVKQAIESTNGENELYNTSLQYTRNRYKE